MFEINPDEQLYCNAYSYWYNNVNTIGNRPSPCIANPLWNDHSKFKKWLHDTYRVTVRTRNLNIVLEFDNPQDKTLFVLRWAEN
jgi:hypothetical protein